MFGHPSFLVSLFCRKSTFMLWEKIQKSKWMICFNRVMSQNKKNIFFLPHPSSINYLVRCTYPYIYVCWWRHMKNSCESLVGTLLLSPLPIIIITFVILANTPIVYSMPVNAFTVLCTSTNLPLTATRWGRCCYNPHLVDGTEAD